MSGEMAASGSSSSRGGGVGSTSAQNHPYRLEIQEITPVSASILWSLRPPPISAIPRKLLRHSKQPGQQRQHQTTTSNSSSSSLPSSQTRRNPANRLLAEAGAMAARSVNRKVTRVTLRNISPNAKQTGPTKQNQSHHLSTESEDWPSDDGATAVDEDEQREDDDVDHERNLDNDASRLNADDCSETSEDGTASAKIFDSGVSICVNGVPWSQVMMGDRGADEAFMIIYGLSPSRDYELLLKVQGEIGAVVALSTAAESEDQITSSVERTSPEITKHTTQIAPPAPRLGAHTPPMQDTDTSPLDGPNESTGMSISATTATATSTQTIVSAAAIQASIRRARKEASRAESALRSEIEAIKRGLERMSDVDHRSKQKVLALQESIRQATIHAKDIEEEAIELEGEREEWERKEGEKEAEVQEVKRHVGESLRKGDAKIRQDEEEVEAVGKELQKMTKILEDKWNAKLKTETDKVVEAEQELMRVQMEIENLLRPQYLPQSGTLSYPPASQERVGTSQSSQVLGRGKGRAVVKGGGNRSTANSAAGYSTSRKMYSRAKGQGYSDGSEGPPFEYQGTSSSSTHGSTLNPHNPEFIPANASPVVAKTATVPDYSPSATSRSAFISSPLSNRDLESQFNLRNNASLPTAVSRTLGGSTNHTIGAPYWSTSSITSSPTLGHDIWGAIPSNPSPLASSHQSPTLVSSLQTSFPLGLNKSPIRNSTQANTTFTSSPNEELHHRNVPFIQFPLQDESANDRRGSYPVFPSLQS